MKRFCPAFKKEEGCALDIKFREPFFRLSPFFLRLKFVKVVCLHRLHSERHISLCERYFRLNVMYFVLVLCYVFV